MVAGSHHTNLLKSLVIMSDFLHKDCELSQHMEKGIPDTLVWKYRV